MAKALKDILEVYAPRSKDEKRFKDKHVVARSKLDTPSEDDNMFNANNIKVIDREKTKHGYNLGKDESVYEEAKKLHPMALHVSNAGKGKYKVHAVGSDLADGIKVGEHLSDTELDDATEMGAKVVNKNTLIKTKIKESIFGEDGNVYEAVHPMALHVKPVSVNGKTKYKVHAVGKDMADGIEVGEHLSDTQLDDATEMGAKIKHLKEDTLDEKKLTAAEMKKREEVAKAIDRENPRMPMSKKMAIATSTAKKVAEGVEDINESDSSHKAFQDQHNTAAAHIKGMTKSLSNHYDNVTNKNQYNKGEAQWHHVNAIKNINRALEDLHQQIDQETDYSRPPKPIKEDLDDESVDLLNLVYSSLTDENKAILEDIMENNPDDLYNFLDQLEVQNG